MGWVVAVFVVLIAVAIWAWAAENSRKSTLEAHVRGLDGFTAQHILIGADGITALAVDDDRKQVCLVASAGGSIGHRMLAYASIMSVEVEEDGAVISSVSRGSQLAGAAVGGLLLGGVGAVVGAMTGARKEKRQVSRVVLKVTTEDVVDPLFRVTLQNVPSPSDGVVYKATCLQTSEWQGRLEAVMRQAARIEAN